MSQKLSVEGLGSPPETSNLRFSIYDLRSVKKDIANVFDAAEHGDSRAIMKFSKAKNFNVDAKVRNDVAYLHIHNLFITNSYIQILIRISHCFIHMTLQFCINDYQTYDCSFNLLFLNFIVTRSKTLKYKLNSCQMNQ